MVSLKIDCRSAPGVSNQVCSPPAALRSPSSRPGSPARCLKTPGSPTPLSLGSQRPISQPNLRRKLFSSDRAPTDWRLGVYTETRQETAVKQQLLARTPAVSLPATESEDEGESAPADIAADHASTSSTLTTATEEEQRINGLKYARLWYFTHSAALVFVLPYLNLHYRHLGFTAQQIGILGALRPWVSAPAGPIWAAVADATKAHRLILIAGFAISTCTRSSMALSGSFVIQMALTVLTEMFGAPIGIIADSSVMASVKEEGDYGKQRMWGAIGWGGMSALSGILVSAKGMNAAFVTYFLVSVAALAPTALLPVHALQQKEAKPHPVATVTLDDEEVVVEPPEVYYTRGRLLFSMDMDLTDAEGGASPDHDMTAARLHSHSAAGPSYLDAVHSLRGSGRSNIVPAKGLLASRRSADRGLQLEQAIDADREISGGWVKSDWEGDWQAAEASTSVLAQPRSGGSAAATAVVAAPQYSPADALDALAAPESPAKLGFWDAVKVLLSEPEVVAFFLISTVMGFASGTIGSYLFLFLDELGATETLMGLAISMACLTEVPVFFFAGKIIDRLGVRNVLNLAVGAYVLRLACYSMLGSFGTPWAVLPIEALHGVTFGCSWAAGTVNCSRISPPGLKSTTQAIFAGLYFGVGTGLGALIGGFVYQEYGAPAVFRTAAVGVAGAWLLCTTLPMLIKGKAKTA